MTWRGREGEGPNQLLNVSVVLHSVEMFNSLVYLLTLNQVEFTENPAGFCRWKLEKTEIISDIRDLFLLVKICRFTDGFLSPTITWGRLLSTSLRLSPSWLAVRALVLQSQGVTAVVHGC